MRQIEQNQARFGNLRLLKIIALVLAFLSFCGIWMDSVRDEVSNEKIQQKEMLHLNSTNNPKQTAPILHSTIEAPAYTSIQNESISSLNELEAQIQEQMSSSAIQQPQSKIEVDHDRKATLVLMSYSKKRFPNINMLLWNYRQMNGVLEKIIFVWNNYHEDPPEILQLFNRTSSFDQKNDYVPIELFVNNENKLTNRYEAPTQLQPNLEAPILIVDDDVYLDAGVIQKMIQSWQDCGTLCHIGLDPRYADPFKQSYNYEAPRNTKPNLVITKTMLVTNKYFHNFFQHPDLVQKAAPPGSGCDDISFSLSVTNITQVLPRFLPGEIRGAPDTSTPQKFYVSDSNWTVVGYRYDLPEDDGQSVGDSSSWTGKRNECVKFSLQYVGDTLTSFLSSQS